MNSQSTADANASTVTAYLHHPTVFFDGPCGFCQTFIRLVLRHDQRHLFRFASIQSSLGRQVYAEFKLSADAPDSFALFSNGRLHLRSEAVFEIARQLGGLWRTLLLFRVFPRRLSDWVYIVIARNRYRWFGRQDACMIPPDDSRQWFLD